MDIGIRTGDGTTTACEALVVGVPAGDGVPRALRALDRALGGSIAEALESGDFKAKPGESFRVPAEGVRAQRVQLIGLGDDSKLDAEALRRFAAAAVRFAMERKAKSLTLAGPAPRRPDAANVGSALAEGVVLGSYRFDKYRKLEDPPGVVEDVHILASDARRAARLRSGVRTGKIVAESTTFARDLSNEPGSVHTPVWLAAAARKMAREVGLKATVLTERELEQRHMGGLLAVGRGSVNPPRMIVLEHHAPKRGERRRATVALVGKGITFDTGGVSIKPSASMEEMKHDMSGGAAVIGAMRAIAMLNLPVRVIGIIAAAENKPDGNAYLPGDVVTTSSGKTIEVVNTDAEGRVVLSDALHYATSEEPDAIVDLATLTGACVVALGSACAGVMGNDDKLIERLRTSGEASRERVWPLPLWDEHKKQIESHIADIKNVGGREAGTLTAGAFLSHFVGETAWAHLDIAGVAWTNQPSPTCVKGATGYGVRLLVELLRGWRS